MLTRSRALRAFALVAAATLVAGCHQGITPASTLAESPTSSSTSGASGIGGSLQLPPHMPSFGLGAPNTTQGKPIAMNAVILCTKGGPTQITGIEPKDSKGLTVVDWGVRPYPPPGEDLGLWMGRVLDNHTFSQDPVSSTCSTHSYTELDISAKRDAAIGTLDGFYVVSGDTKLLVPMRIALCPQVCPANSLPTS